MHLGTNLMGLVMATVLLGATVRTPTATASPAGSSPPGPSVTSQPGNVMVTAAIACSELATHDFSSLPDVSLRISSATDVAATGTDPASCKITGTVASNAQFVLQLPSTGWTGQY